MAAGHFDCRDSVFDSAVHAAPAVEICCFGGCGSPCAIGLVFLIDIFRHSTLLTMTRYVIPAAPGVYAILAAPLPGRIGKLSPWVILVGVLVFSVDYWQIGPPVSQDVDEHLESLQAGGVAERRGDYHRELLLSRRIRGRR